MTKIMINYSLNNKGKTIKGILKDKKIIFNDDDSIINIELLDDIILKRENNKIINEMHFGKNNYCKYYLKEYDKYIDIIIKLINLNILDNYLEIIYEIENQRMEFKLNYEVI